MKIILRAKITNNNGQKRLVFENPDYYRDIINRLNENYPAFVEIRNDVPKRSVKVNRYWHGVCFPLIAEMTGYTNEEAKAICKTMFLEPKIVEVKGFEVEIQKGTAELDKKEATDFTDKIRNLAVDLGGYIPTPCEAGYLCGRDECLICNPPEGKELDYPTSGGDPDAIQNAFDQV